MKMAEMTKINIPKAPTFLSTAPLLGGMRDVVAVDVEVVSVVSGVLVVGAGVTVTV